MTPRFAIARCIYRLVFAVVVERLFGNIHANVYKKFMNSGIHDSPRLRGLIVSSECALCTVPLTLLFTNTNSGHVIKGFQKAINHYFFMDQLKHYGRFESRGTSLLDSGYTFRNDLRMG